MAITSLKKHSIFLKWWWFFTLIVALTVVLIGFGVHEDLWIKDKTKLSFFILFIFYAMTLHCGYESWKLSQLANGDIEKLDHIDTRHEPGWFASDILLTLGLVGTVSGFILMLAGAFTGINIANVTSSQIKVSVFITVSSVDYHLVKDAPVPAQSAIQILDGGAKFVLQNGDALKVQSDTASSADVWLSRVDTISE